MITTENSTVRTWGARGAKQWVLPLLRCTRMGATRGAGTCATAQEQQGLHVLITVACSWPLCLCVCAAHQQCDSRCLSSAALLSARYLYLCLPFLFPLFPFFSSGGAQNNHIILAHAISPSPDSGQFFTYAPARSAGSFCPHAGRHFFLTLNTETGCSSTSTSSSAVKKPPLASKHAATDRLEPSWGKSRAWRSQAATFCPYRSQ
jgi:hypothetical protein